MFPSGNSVSSVQCAGKYRSIRYTKISVVQTGIFGRMERAPSFLAFATERELGSNTLPSIADLSKV